MAITLVIAAAAGITLNLTQAQAANGVYDTDGDNLIEIDNLEQLDAIRYDPDGNGAADNASDNDSYATAFPVSGSDKVCTIGCTGYELKRSLDFDSDASFASGAINFDWFSGGGWPPINGFGATFDGNGNTISNIYVNRTAENNIGLFGSTEDTAAIKGIGLLNADVTGKQNVGALLGTNHGTVSRSYATGSVAGNAGYDNVGGGLVGYNYGTVTNSYAHVTITSYTGGGLVGRNGGTVSGSYATGPVSGSSRLGGLVGGNAEGATITGSYATGEVTARTAVGGLVGSNEGTVSSSYATGAATGGRERRGAYGTNTSGGLVGWNVGTVNSSYAISPVSAARSGGLIGYNDGTISNSYWNADVISRGVGEGTGAEGKTTAELKAPTGRTGIYARWNPQYWDFGTSSQYPLLKADMDGDGTATWQEFGPQIEGDRPAPTPTPMPTATNTPMPTATNTPTATPGPTVTTPPTRTATSTATPRPTVTTPPTRTATSTARPRPTATPTPTLTPTSTATPSPTATATPTPTPTPAPVLSSGYNSSCLLGSDGSASCWDSRTGDQGAPPAGARFTAITSGYGHSCGLRTDGTVVCWGSDSQGQSTPPEGRFTAISSGFTHTCALRTDGTAACWGNNRSGQATPPDATPFTVLNSGLAHTCGQRVDGVVVCWGGLSGTFGE